MVESEIALGFLRERAWIEAEAEFRRRTEIDRAAVIDMRDQGMSFDAIAAVHGWSHDTIAKIVASGATPRKRARWLFTSRNRGFERARMSAFWIEAVFSEGNVVFQSLAGLGYQSPLRKHRTACSMANANSTSLPSAYSMTT
ncbi:MAG: helix-turn-helix domain-containing protein [Burkholderiaceae bacterium]|nr:helix-turn-helix domain-containing protein [Burkholderiaceae bacterium]